MHSTADERKGEKEEKKLSLQDAYLSHPHPSSALGFMVDVKIYQCFHR